MDDDRGGGALARGFLELVGPAAVVGHRLAAEQRFVAGDEPGIVDEDERRLAAHVEAGVVVPASLGRVDAVADEHDLAASHGRLWLHAARTDHHVVAVGQRHAAGAAIEQQRLRTAGDLDEGHVLAKVAARRRLQAELEILLFEVLEHLAFALGTRLAALQLVGSELLDMGAVGCAPDGLRGLSQHPVVGVEGAEREREQCRKEQQPQFHVQSRHVIPRAARPQASSTR